MKPEKRGSAAIAVHEAGHAVAAILGGIAVRHAKLIAGNPKIAVRRSAKHSEWNGYVDWDTRHKKADTRAHAISYLAGDIAQPRFVGGWVHPYGGTHDRAKVVEIIRKLVEAENPFPQYPVDLIDPPLIYFDSDVDPLSNFTPADRRRFHEYWDQCKRITQAREQAGRRMLARLRRETQAMVAGNWQTIGAVAAALLKRGVLTGAEIRRIIEGVELNDLTRSPAAE